MDYKNLLTEIIDGIFIIKINRPDKRNALNSQTIKEIDHAVQEAEQKKIEGIIFTGEGEESFIAGADIKEFSEYSKAEGDQMVKYGQHVLKKIEGFHKPTLAAINGYALGGGCELAMACHLRIGSHNAMFGQPEVKLGIIPGYGGSQRLIQLIGKSKATEYLLTGKFMTANEALKLGMLNYIVKKEILISESISFLKQISENSPIAIKSIIKTINAFYSKDCDGFQTELNEFSKCFGSSDFFEGTRAFLAKRKPIFK